MRRPYVISGETREGLVKFEFEIADRDLVPVGLAIAHDLGCAEPKVVERVFAGDTENVVVTHDITEVFK